MRACVIALVAAFASMIPGQALALDAAASDSLVWRDAAHLAVRTDSLTVDAFTRRVELTRRPVLEVLALRVDGIAVGAESYQLLGPAGAVLLREARADAASVVVRYRYDPVRLLGFVQLREPLPPGDSEPASETMRSTARDTSRVDATPGRLDIRGSKTVSIEGGTNRDATVDQGLNLSIQGSLTETIGVRAEISDENLPITPEGNTEELSDLDQVRIELFGPRGRATLGDFRLNRDLGRFVPYERKLQGLDLVGLDPRGRVEVLGGTPQGRRVEVELRGREAVQGPYELLDVRRIGTTFIVAGSERVWVDGQPVTRGEDNDYTIDYVRGTITFTSRRPVFTGTRIAIDYEAGDTGYRRNVVGAIVDSVGVGPVRVGVAALREGDDPDRPRDRSLDADEIAALTAAGDDPGAARSDGVRSTEPGEGAYREEFTPEGVRFFVLADSAGGDFDVDFRFVGEDEGAYRVRGVDVDGRLTFEFVGAGAGDYAIGRALPLPKVTDVFVVHAQVGRDETTGFARLEMDRTVHDANRFSPLDDGDNEGGAFHFQAIGPWWFGDRDQGRGLRLRARAERIEDRFFALGRLRQPFFYDAWNLQDEVRSTTEDFVDLGAQWSTRERRIDASWQRLDRRESLRGQRLETRGDGRIVGPFHFRHALAATRAERPSGGESDRDDRSLRLQWTDSGIMPFVELRDEEFVDRDPANVRGFRSDTVEVGTEVQGVGRVSWAHEVADSLSRVTDEFTFARDLSTWRALGRVGGPAARLEMDLTWRRAELPGDVEEVTRLAVVGFDRQDRDRGLSLDLDYRVSNDQSRVLGREIVFVGLNEGSFDIEGNPVGVNQGDYEVVFTPSDSLVSSTEVEVSARIDLQPSTTRFGGFGNVFLWQVRERSRTDEVGSLLWLDPDVVRDPELTVFGEQRLRNELTLLRRIRRHDLRVDHERSDGLDQRFQGGAEERQQRRTEVRFESELVSGLAARLEVGAETRRRRSADETNPLRRSYEVEDRTAATALRWRRDRSTRLELEGRWTGRTETDAGIEQTILALSPSVTTGVLGLQATVQARFADVSESSDPSLVRPFFFERPGTQRSASVRLQWGGTGTLTVGLRYSVRDEPDRPLRQDLGVETRARF